MATRYTTGKCPDMAVIMGQSGIYVELHDGLVKVTPKGPAEVEQLITDQFQVVDASVSWSDLRATTVDEPEVVQ